MKCLRNPIDGQIRRVQPPEGRKLASYGWEYVPKSVWKASVRPDLAKAKAGAAEAAKQVINSGGIRRL